MIESIDLSAILITKNEATNIDRCLRSLTWAKEVVIVDSYSTDNTVELASGYKNVKIISTEWKGFVENKKLAVKNSSCDWILWVDADEEVTEELRLEISSTLRMHSDYYAFDLPRKTFFLGEWVKHCGWYPGRVTRLFNKNYCRFNESILHEGLEVEKGRCGHLKNDLLHYSYTSLYQYFDKMNYYGKAGAEELKRKGKKFGFHQVVLNPVSTFIKIYFFKGGILDGKKGFIISIGSSFSNFIKYTNFWYLQKKTKSEG